LTAFKMDAQHARPLLELVRAKLEVHPNASGTNINAA